jgi:UDP-N-acetylmuramoyl-tripeptide--D-alanyl-D-alanine ligase
MTNQIMIDSINKLCQNNKFELRNSNTLKTIRYFSQDSRKIEKNDVYVAIKGESNDGHAFIDSAIQKKASLIISEKELDINTAYIFCDNSISCLQELAKIYRKAHAAQFIGLTGSSGKTSTKELLLSVLKEQYKVASTIGNYNNHIGLPLSILNIPADIEIAVIELGTNHPGEIKFLTEILDPDLAVITNIGLGHIGNYGSIDDLAFEKTDLFRSSREDCKLFINLDDERLKNYKDQRPNVFFSLESTIQNLQSDQIGKYSFTLEGESIHLDLLGKHQVLNAVLVINLAKELGLSAGKIKIGLEKAKAVSGRMEGLQLGNYYVINDAYNANPSSMTKALEYLVDLEAKNKIAILGDMGELGADSIQYHQTIIDQFSHSNILEFLLFGNLFF